MNPRITLTLGAAAGGVLAAAFLPVAVAFADTGSAVDAAAAAATGSFPTVPGPDAFTIGPDTFDPYLGTTIVTAPSTEGFNPLTEGVGSSPYFGTGETTQNFLVYDTPSGSTTPVELGSIGGTENVTNFGSITNTGFVVDGDEGVGTSVAGLPTGGTVFDVTNFGGGFSNDYTDIPGATASAPGTVTDTLVTPFGNYDLSDLFTSFDVSSLDPGAAFGVSADAAGAAADAVGGVDPLSFLGL